MTNRIVEFIVSKINTFAEFQSRKIDDLGNQTSYWFGCNLDRYIFDFDPTLKTQGWEPYDTTQDAPYFGVWVNTAALCILTYAEGDIILEVCPSVSQFKTHLQRIAKFYGDAPPSAVMFDNDGTRTEIYVPRPNDNELFSAENVIHTYLRADAINDGFLFPVSAQMQKLAGFNFPIALTLKVWDSYVEWMQEDNAKQTIQDQNARLLNLLRELHFAIKNNKADGCFLSFSFKAIPRDGQSTQSQDITLLSSCHPGDSGEPVITVMFDALDN